jgi:hypothetical protein
MAQQIGAEKLGQQIGYLSGKTEKYRPRKQSVSLTFR